MMDPCTDDSMSMGSVVVSTLNGSVDTCQHIMMDPCTGDSMGSVVVSTLLDSAGGVYARFRCDVYTRFDCDV